MMSQTQQLAWLFLMGSIGLTAAYADRDSGSDSSEAGKPCAPASTRPSPNGQDDCALAYLQLTDGHWQIWVCGSAGDHARQLTSDPTDKRSPRWSHDGRAIFYRTANHEPFILRLEGGAAERILPEAGLIGEVTPTDDPKQVVYTRYRTTVLDTSDLWIARLDGSDRRMITSEVGLQYSPAVSPDGKRIAYISGHGYGTHELSLGGIDGQNHRKLTSNRTVEASPAWSPDGRRVAYASDETGDYEIWIIDADGQRRKRLTESDGIDTHPCWSPDGRRLAFTSSRGGELGIWVMNVDGKNPTQVTRGKPSRAPSWRRSEP